MLEELRLYPRSPAARTGVCRAGENAASARRADGPRLSTGYAGLPRLGSTSARWRIHSAAGRTHKEEVD